ncbi:MAG TPA: AAA family ATPase, partial [Blastocatellia bacterium]
MNGHESEYYEFGPFRLDPAERRLLRDGRPVPLTIKAFDTLVALVENSPRLAERDQLMRKVWPDSFVEEGNLKVIIHMLRKALGESNEQRYIETVPRRGYRFTATVRKVSAQPVPALWPREAPSTVATFLVGRDEELGLLSACFEKALAGRRQVILITGEPGIGKTSLVSAFLERAAGLGGAIARGQCLEHYGAGEAYMPVLDALSRLGRQAGRERLVELLYGHAPLWLAQMPSFISPEERLALNREVLGATRERMLRELAEAIESLTAATPLVLALEDLHWSDYSTLDFVSYLAHRQESARLLLVGTYRPAEVMLSGHPLRAVKQELRAHRLCEELRLGFLTLPSVSDYLASRFPRNAFPPDLARLIYRRTEGNPLFMSNVADYLVASGSIVQVGDMWQLNTEVESLEVGVPDDIRQMIEKQIDQLSQEERRTLEAASVAGTDFSTAMVAAAMGEDAIQIEERCDEMVRRHQFLSAGSISELLDGTPTMRYSFIHSLYQNAIYENISAARRAQLHRRIGEHLEKLYGERAEDVAAELAMHFEQARDYHRAIRHFHRAAENATRRFANQEAVSLAQRALDLLSLLPPSADRDQQELMLRITLGNPLMATEGFGNDEVKKNYTCARELCRQSGEGLQLFPALSGLWRFYLIRAELKTARELAEQLLRIAHSEGEADLLVEAHWMLGCTFVNLGEFAAASEHLDRGLALYKPAEQQSLLFLYGHDPGVACRCFGAWADWSLGFADRAIERMDQAIALARDLHHPETLAYALFFTAWLHQLRRESVETLKWAETTIAHATEHGLVQWAAFGKSLLGWAMAREGQSAEGIARMREALAVYQSIGSEISRPHFLALLAEALGQVGEPRQGLSVLAEALELALTTGGRYYEAEIHQLRGDLMIMSDDRAMIEVEEC